MTSDTKSLYLGRPRGLCSCPRTGLRRPSTLQPHYPRSVTLHGTSSLSPFVDGTPSLSDPVLPRPEDPILHPTPVRPRPSLHDTLHRPTPPHLSPRSPLSSLPSRLRTPPSPGLSLSFESRCPQIPTESYPLRRGFFLQDSLVLHSSRRVSPESTPLREFSPSVGLSDSDTEWRPSLLRPVHCFDHEGPYNRHPVRDQTFREGTYLNRFRDTPPRSWP